MSLLSCAQGCAEGAQRKHPSRKASRRRGPCSFEGVWNLAKGTELGRGVRMLLPWLCPGSAGLPSPPEVGDA